MTRDWGRLHNGEFYTLYLSQNIIRVPKYKRIRGTVHMACLGEGVVNTEFWWGDSKEVDHLEDLRLDGKIILKWIVKKQNMEEWIGLILLRIGTDVRLL